MQQGVASKKAIPQKEVAKQKTITQKETVKKNPKNKKEEDKDKKEIFRDFMLVRVSFIGPFGKFSITLNLMASKIMPYFLEGPINETLPYTIGSRFKVRLILDPY